MAAGFWMLLQTLWVGGIWILHFMVLPGLYSVGLASLLIEEIAGVLMPQMVFITLVCVLMQAGLLVRQRRLSALWGERRGQLLLAVLAIASGLLVSLALWPDAVRWQLFSYLLLAFFGLLLVLQPVPRKSVAADPTVG
ncbi:DUF4149 domain-containing protein [Pseudomonas daroniae]|uniref:DUF4149 domain-containing protein n=2 Tax=Pseudomonadales TaxID=72274 RepID=A0A4Q9QRH5_9GAMM|nr:DUF4149 domain-containing protein [Pseudomonas daroniae]TBU82787.1 DUF4149 domain-containing protein [Pseudomonas daroniae]TBU86013.1 DUF4149 domain-containing protein [Pseudomonas sp. FRB 228]TBU95176.1 DUF4149 domain-containing protein [Pseudomonas daroniae]